ncbi:hypothetical protein V3C99_002032 [Haemonchus contortus]|uniref:Uncharacterized protein n=1 Tax=Haemonchus contortus TaxID=6289 RepID=A0A7I4YBW8_HAECO
MAQKGEAPFPEFILEREFQCHNTLLIKDVVCKTIQKFVKDPQDVRLSITVTFQPRFTAKVASHEHEAIAVIEVDKPGDFYPGGQEQRWRDRELEVLKKVEQEKRQERNEIRKKLLEEKAKPKTGVKRPPRTNASGKAPPAQAAPPRPLKAEVRRLPAGEFYAVREVVGLMRYRRRGSPRLSPLRCLFRDESPVFVDKGMTMLEEERRPCTEEMPAIREPGERGDDATERDGSSMEAVDILSDVEYDVGDRKRVTYIGLPSSFEIKVKEPMKKRGSIELEDDGRSKKVIAHITVE